MTEREKTEVTLPEVPVIRIRPSIGWVSLKLDELWEDAKSLFDDSGDSDSDSVTSEDTTTTTTSATVTTDRDWTWVAFASKPAEDIRKRLTALGGRWSRKRGSWYFRTLDVDLSWLA